MIKEENPRLGFLGFTSPHTVSTLAGIKTLSFDKLNFSTLTAIAAPPPVLLGLGVLIYLIPCN